MGPLARLNTVDFIPSPLAQQESRPTGQLPGESPHACLHTHWARLIECLHAAEMIRELLGDADLQGGTWW